jgi:hypothetical protein
MKKQDEFPKFSNGIRIYEATPSSMNRRQKWNWSDIPVDGCMEIQAEVFPAETRVQPNGGTNAGRAAYAYANRNKLKFTVEKMPGGNVRVFNRGPKNEVI